MRIRRATAQTRPRRTRGGYPPRLGRNSDGQRDRVKESVDDHAGVDAVDPAAEIGEACSERGEEWKCLYEAVRKSEGNSDEHDRRPASEPDEQRVAKPTERELLDDRGDDSDHETVGDVRRRMVRFPPIRSD